MRQARCGVRRTQPDSDGDERDLRTQRDAEAGALAAGFEHRCRERQPHFLAIEPAGRRRTQLLRAIETPNRYKTTKIRTIRGPKLETGFAIRHLARSAGVRCVYHPQTGLLLQPGDLGFTKSRSSRRPLRQDSRLAALAPGPAPPLDRPRADQQGNGNGNFRALLPALETLHGLEP
ncbi:hypothetical protein ABZT27_14565 [Streptomyces sp. NPDC005389]|uniref:hypothetical protein n=1 Tax=Streptomyces sp. NPDC005389 TaxID=3157040 RepID=UPI00339E2B4B